MAFPAILAPILLTGLAFLSKSKYNAKLLEYFRTQKYTNSTLELYGINQYTASESTATKEIMKLKLIHSPRVFKSVLFSFWLLIVMLSVMLEKIICQGWITGEKCAFEKIGIPFLSAGFMLVPFLGEIVIIYMHFKEQHRIQKPWMRKFPALMFALATTPCIISGLIEIVYHKFWYDETEKIKIFPLDEGEHSSIKDDLSLDEILENETSKNFFQAFLVETLCVENLIFIQHLKQFKASNEFQTENFAKKIYHYFIQEGSIAQVNISGKTRNKIKEKFNNQNISLEVFKEAEDEVIFLLTYHSLSKFKSSPYYAQVVDQVFT
eukprot:snap_masked-scaffold_27-processed-gene-3.9-mRNA-1 protein AED:1.00 eAED:1.00 QI:0/0/0/0/1/1/2/0/321